MVRVLPLSPARQRVRSSRRLNTSLSVFQTVVTVRRTGGRRPAQTQASRVAARQRLVREQPRNSQAARPAAHYTPINIKISPQPTSALRIVSIEETAL